MQENKSGESGISEEEDNEKTRETKPENREEKECGSFIFYTFRSHL